MPDKLRFSLALILLFIAPSAWGQQYDGLMSGCNSGEIWHERGGCTKLIGGPLTGKNCEKPGHFLTADGSCKVPDGLLITALQCEPGWIPVQRLDIRSGAWCAWVLKEPIYK